MKPFTILVYVFYTFLFSKAEYEDIRCRCICLGISVILNGTDMSQISRLKQTNNDPRRNRCNCDIVMLPMIKEELTLSEMREFCSKCICQFQVRRTTMIKVVVLILLWVIAILVVYMFLKPSFGAFRI